MIKLDHLNKFFNKGKSNEIHVINDISLDFPDHGMVAIFGRSDCGKTTLLNVIGGLDNKNSGSVFIEGQKMSPNQDELRNRYIGYIFQNYCLNPNETCYENVAAALKLCGMKEEEEIRSRVMFALSLVGMQQYYKRTPNALSGGQQQRIAIARALVKNPPVILADEPTGNLDEANTIMIMDILKEISKTHLVLLVTHEANLVDYYCDSVIELSDGRVVNVRNNDEVNGYVAKSKNVIYLGEYEKREMPGEAVDLSYYGDLPEKPVSVRMVNRNGVLYLKVETPGVHVLDETSEVHFEEGSFEEKAREKSAEISFDTSALTLTEGKSYGKLFSFMDGVKSGLKQVFSVTKNKKSAKRLRRILIIFAIIVVFNIAMSATAIREYTDLKDQYNQCAVNVELYDGVFDGEPVLSASGYQKLLAVADDPESCVERVLFTMELPPGRVDFEFGLGSFETYRQSALSGSSTEMSVRTNIRPMKDSVGKKIVCEINPEQNILNITITTKVADRLLKEPTYSFVSKYSDLLGMTSQHDAYVSSYILRVYKEVRLKEEKENPKKEQSDDDEFYDESDAYYYDNEDYYYDSYSDTFRSKEELYKKYEQYPGGDWIADYFASRGQGRTVMPGFRITRIIDSDELVIYMDEAFLTNDRTVSSITAPSSEDGEYPVAVFYSTDVNKTASYLKNRGLTKVRVPEDFYRDEMNYTKGAMIGSLGSIAMLLGILVLCMFFIMRSIYMVRMKEFGIYRAIGVSKKNLMFRAVVESGVMTTLTVFVGYALTTGFIIYMLSMTKAASRFFYYPWWIKLIVLVFLYVVCILSGTISVRRMLRMTPAEIMAKYDI